MRFRFFGNMNGFGIFTFNCYLHLKLSHLIFCILIVLSITVSAQKKYSLEVISLANSSIIKKIDYKKIFVSKKDREKELQNIIFSLYDNAYLVAKYDSLLYDSLSMKAYVNTGAIYKWAYLKKGNVDEGILSEIHFREQLYNNKPIYYKDVAKLQEKLLVYCENNGYPFASIKLDSIAINENTISAQLKLTKNKLVNIDSVSIKGNAKIAPVYLYNYLSIKPGDPYNESLINKADMRIKELPFINATNTSVVAFSEKETKLILFLDKKKASQFDGFVGILPNEQTSKVLLTGDVHLKLQNSINRGELIELNWRSLQKNTQDLKTRLTYPFLFSTPFGIDYNFKLYKKDTLFIEVNQNIGIQYLLIGGNYFKVFLNNKKSNLLSTKGLEFQTTLPTYADISSNIYGLGYKSEKFDYRFNPRTGYSFNINVGVGTKNIKKNPKLNPVAYNNVTLHSTQYNSDLEASWYLPIKNRSTLKLAMQAAYLLTESIFENELFRIGGFKTLRGFDEESINASAYSIFTLEYRYLLEQNSYLYLFTDGAYYENMSISFNGKDRDDTPIGFGAGISFETKAGIFSINYALGKQFDNPIYLKSGKVHFGIISYF